MPAQTAATISARFSTLGPTRALLSRHRHTDGLQPCLCAAGPRLEAIEPWTQKELEASVRSFAEETGRKLGKVAQPLRAALTGKSTSPGIFDVLDVLGREESLARLRDQTAVIKSA